MINSSLLIAVGALAAFAGCTEATGPEVPGRWAALGIQLSASDSTVELQIACAVPAHVGHGFFTDSASAIRFSTPIQPVWGTPFQVAFVGQRAGRWLFATVTRTFSLGPPVVETYSMLRDGDAGFDKIACPQ